MDASGCLIPALVHGFEVVGVASPDTPTLKALIGIPLRRQFDIIAGPLRDYRAFESAYAERRNALEAVGTVLLPGVAEALKALCDGGGQMAIASTAARTRLERSLARLAIQRFFHPVVAGAEDKGIGIKGALQEARPDRTTRYYVGDRPDDEHWARAADIPFIGVCTGAFAAPAFALGTNGTVLPSVRELPQFLQKR